MNLELVGPSYSLPYFSADCQSTVNMIVSFNEINQQYYLSNIPGLKKFIECKDKVRGFYVDSKRDFFVVEGQEFVRYKTMFNKKKEKYLQRKVLGGIYSKEGKVHFVDNGLQLCVVDGKNLYLYIYQDDTFAQYKPDGWLGSNNVSYSDGFFIFVQPDTQQYYISGLYDGKDINALDFASAESNPDDIVTSIVGGGIVYLLGEKTTEIVQNSGDVDFPFSKASGGAISIGCIASESVKIVSNTIFWLGRSEEGFGIVYSNQVGTLSPARVSNFAVEGFIQKQKDLDKATAYTYQENGHNFYCLNFEEGNTTWCLDLNTMMWHERKYLLKNGVETRHIVEDHCIYDNKHLVYAKDSNIIYEQSVNFLSFDGEPIRKYRRSTQYKADDLNRMVFNEFILDLQVGDINSKDSKIYLRYSNDGGYTWSNYLGHSLGETGNYTKRIRWRRLGTARNRVWEISCTDDVSLVLLNAFAR